MGRSPRVALLALVAVGALLLAGCSDDDSTESSSDGTTGTTAATDDTMADVASTDVQTVAIDGGDFSYDGVPSEIPAGAVTVELTNTGEEEHQATILAVPDGQAPEEYLAAAAAAGGVPDDAEFFGGPNGVEPGQTRSATTALDAGDYVVVCFIPSPSDGIPHAVKGMVAPFTVTEGDAPAELATEDQQIELLDYSFDLPDDLDPTAPVTIRNVGEEPHELVAYRVADGSTYDDALALLTTPPGTGATPPEPFPLAGGSGVAAMSPGVANGTDLEMTDGTYVLICFLPDADGLPHFLRGMVQPFEVGGDG